VLEYRAISCFEENVAPPLWMVDSIESNPHNMYHEKVESLDSVHKPKRINK
jgi:hypothetical protein